MIIKSVDLETVCGVTSRLPENTLPEFAFAGKSNVGKSSLINALMNRKSYARTSSQPGKTQTINFTTSIQALYYVDLPGYGYAKVSLEARAKWGKMIERYLQKSPCLSWCFFWWISATSPSANDKMMYDWVVSNGYHPVIIATKLDKLKRSQVPKAVKTIRTGLGMEKEDILIPFSAETKQGREEIWELIESVALGNRRIKKRDSPAISIQPGSPLQQLTDINTKIRINAHPDITLKGKDNRGKFGGS